MKNKYENVEIEVVMMDAQDVITTSVYVEWGDGWEGGNQDDGWYGNIFG